jgi:hypothetical protein
MTQRATIPGTVLLLEVYTQIRSELEPAATTKWLCSILECWSSTNIASLLVELFEESDRFTRYATCSVWLLGCILACTTACGRACDAAV